jgi:hypothetical protein
MAFASTLSQQDFLPSFTLFSPTAMWENVFLLILTAAIKVLLTAWTFGMMVRHRRPKSYATRNRELLERFPLEYSCPPSL